MMTRQPDRPSYAWVEKPEDVGMRLVDFSDKLVGLRHNGWYCNDFQDEVFRGVVYRLPHSRGFIAGYADPWNDGSAFVEIYPYATERDAAFAADSIAEHEAERQREFEAQETAKIEQELAAERFARCVERSRPDMYA